jgi:oligosaccharide amylase
MPGAIIGNSAMLACIRSSGELYKIFWPQIEWPQHLGILWTGLNLRKEQCHETLWFHSDLWLARQQYVEDTNIVETIYLSRLHRLKVTQTDFVLPNEDTLVRRYRIENHGLETIWPLFMLYSSMYLEESNLYDCAYFDAENHSLVFFRNKICFSLGSENRDLEGFQCGRRGSPSDPLNSANSGCLCGMPDNMLMSAGALSWNEGELKPGMVAERSLFIVAGNTAEKNAEQLRLLQAKDAADWEDHTTGYWRGFLHKAKCLQAGVPEVSLFRRSILTLQLMTNKKTGAHIAAPEFDPHYTMCGGYGYCWGRDGTFAAVALDEAGYHSQAEQFYGFTVKVQCPDGSWHQRYFTDGSPAPTWGKQIDQTGAILWGYGHHYRLNPSKRFLDRVWPSVMSGANYLIASLQENSLPAAGMDLWEDEYSQSTYTAAATYGGLMAAAELAKVVGEAEMSSQWGTSANRVRSAILSLQWAEEHNRFIRAVNRRVGFGDYEQARNNGETAYSGTDDAGIYPNFWVPKDQRLDAALLGLTYPFGVLQPGDAMMAATASAIENELWNTTVGGVHRYTGDLYRGGNPWLITTFWLAIYHSLAGDKEKAKVFHSWCLDQASPLLLLPEQANSVRGGPSWVLPLGWSHAMYILSALALNGRLSV